MLSKSQLIEGIQQINISACRDWLAAFDRESLLAYFRHLQVTQEPRGRHSTWSRPGDMPAVVTRRTVLG
ncbi:MAG: hypothetical protein CMJ32_00725 [Phycisphaerae bacterium]|nr:hypothetical protein [Phycisphaerae bacterium]